MHLQHLLPLLGIAASTLARPTRNEAEVPAGAGTAPSANLHERQEIAGSGARAVAIDDGATKFLPIHRGDIMLSPLPTKFPRPRIGYPASFYNHNGDMPSDDIDPNTGGQNPGDPGLTDQDPADPGITDPSPIDPGLTGQAPDDGPGGLDALPVSDNPPTPNPDDVKLDDAKNTIPVPVDGTVPVKNGVSDFVDALNPDNAPKNTMSDFVNSLNPPNTISDFVDNLNPDTEAPSISKLFDGPPGADADPADQSDLARREALNMLSQTVKADPTELETPAVPTGGLSPEEMVAMYDNLHDVFIGPIECTRKLPADNKTVIIPRPRKTIPTYIKRRWDDALANAWESIGGDYQNLRQGWGQRVKRDNTEDNINEEDLASLHRIIEILDTDDEETRKQQVVSRPSHLRRWIQLKFLRLFGIPPSASEIAQEIIAALFGFNVYKRDVDEQSSKIERRGKVFDPSRFRIGVPLKPTTKPILPKIPCKLSGTGDKTKPPGRYTSNVKRSDINVARTSSRRNLHRRRYLPDWPSWLNSWWSNTETHPLYLTAQGAPDMSAMREPQPPADPNGSPEPQPMSRIKRRSESPASKWYTDWHQALEWIHIVLWPSDPEDTTPTGDGTDGTGDGTEYTGDYTSYEDPNQYSPPTNLKRGVGDSISGSGWDEEKLQWSIDALERYIAIQKARPQSADSASTPNSDGKQKRDVTKDFLTYLNSIQCQLQPFRRPRIPLPILANDQSTAPNSDVQDTTSKIKRRSPVIMLKPFKSIPWLQLSDYYPWFPRISIKSETATPATTTEPTDTNTDAKMKRNALAHRGWYPVKNIKDWIDRNQSLRPDIGPPSSKRQKKGKKQQKSKRETVDTQSSNVHEKRSLGRLTRNMLSRLRDHDWWKNFSRRDASIKAKRDTPFGGQNDPSLEKAGFRCPIKLKFWSYCHNLGGIEDIPMGPGPEIPPPEQFPPIEPAEQFPAGDLVPEQPSEVAPVVDEYMPTVVREVKKRAPSAWEAGKVRGMDRRKL
ncbi:hypothetical protein ABW21_db0206212 [Orbilia brochopaga]|nr:hypothetical protein ABW21_db0206212 [Drechslerella brochopaga]